MAVFVFAHEEPWFTDRDDGTIIHLFPSGGLIDQIAGTICPSPRIRFEQNVTLGECDAFEDGDTIEIVCPGAGTFSFGDFQIDIVGGLPDDFGFIDGSISRFDDRLTLFLNEFTPSRVGESINLIGEHFSRPVKGFITKYEFRNNESLGTSNGSASQTFTISGSKILLPTKGTPIVFVGGARFSVVDDLSTAGPTDSVFEYDETTGTVTFGDGTNGAIPENGKEIVLRITIRNGGGQWKFIKIVKQPENFKSLANVKSIKDKVFYIQTGIAAADAGQMTTVNSELNVHRSASIGLETGALLAERYVWSAFHGAEFTSSGGTIQLSNTGLTTAFVEPKVLSPSTDHATHTLHTVDSGATYPSFRQEVKQTATKNFLVSSEQVAGQTLNPSQVSRYVAFTKMQGGIITGPKTYRDIMHVYPIVHVVEVIRHGVEFRKHLGGLVFDPTIFVPLPAYWIFVSCWVPHTGVSVNFLHNKFGGVIDSDLQSISEGAFLPIVNDRIRFMKSIADITGGTEAEPLHPAPQTIFPGSTIDFRGYTIPEVAPFNAGNRNNTQYAGGSFVRFVLGDSTRHPEWATMTYGNTLSVPDKAYQSHIGLPLADFDTVFTATQRTQVTSVNNVYFANMGVLKPGAVQDDGFGTPFSSPRCNVIGPTAVLVPTIFDATFLYMAFQGYTPTLLAECAPFADSFVVKRPPLSAPADTAV